MCAPRWSPVNSTGLPCKLARKQAVSIIYCPCAYFARPTVRHLACACHASVFCTQNRHGLISAAVKMILVSGVDARCECPRACRHKTGYSDQMDINCSSTPLAYDYCIITKLLPCNVCARACAVAAAVDECNEPYNKAVIVKSD